MPCLVTTPEGTIPIDHNGNGFPLELGEHGGPGVERSSIKKSIEILRAKQAHDDIVCPGLLPG